MTTAFYIIAMAGFFYLSACLWRDLKRKKTEWTASYYSPEPQIKWIKQLLGIVVREAICPS